MSTPSTTRLIQAGASATTHASAATTDPNRLSYKSGGKIGEVGHAKFTEGLQAQLNRLNRKSSFSTAERVEILNGRNPL